MPGPGKYEIKSQFTIKPPPVNQDEPIIHPPFGTQSRVRHTVYHFYFITVTVSSNKIIAAYTVGLWTE